MLVQRQHHADRHEMSQIYVTTLFALALGFLTVAASFAGTVPGAVPAIATHE